MRKRIGGTGVSRADRPRMFVGSSAEGLKIARALAHQLQDQLEVSIWYKGLFGLGGGTLETLLEEASSFDFACLVLTDDDVTISRGNESQSPRDNVIFECGLFMGQLGRRRTFVVFDSDSSIKIPTDLAGITLASYQGNRRDKNLTAAVDEACHPIRAAVEKLGHVRLGSRAPLSVSNKSGWGTLWIMGSANGLNAQATKLVGKLAPELCSRLISAKYRLVAGDSEMLRHFAVAYRGMKSTTGEFVPNPVIVEGSLRDVRADTLFGAVIGAVPDVAIAIGGSEDRRRVATEYERACEARIPVLTLPFLGGCAAGLTSTASIPDKLSRRMAMPLSAIDAGDLAADIVEAMTVIYSPSGI